MLPVEQETLTLAQHLVLNEKRVQVYIQCTWCILGSFLPNYDFFSIMNEFIYIFHVFESNNLFQSVGFSSVFVSDCCVPSEVNDMQLLFYNSLGESSEYRCLGFLATICMPIFYVIHCVVSVFFH